MTENTADHWSDYWSLGCLTSLPQDFKANYDGEVRAFWESQFETTPTGGSLIDLCTGNGAVALLAAGFALSRNRALEVTAVDAATVRPDIIATRFPDQATLLDRIRFISGVRVETLDLEQQFDLVTSQYGIEYCDHESAAASVARLLKPGGRLVMVCHSAGSDIMAFMQRECEEYALLEELGLFEAIGAYLAKEIPHRELAEALQQVQARLYPEFQARESSLFRSVLETVGGILAMPSGRLEASGAHLQAYHDRVRHGKDRLEDMLRVNRDLAAHPDWVDVFEKAGLEASGSGEIRYRGSHHAGDYFMYSKPRAGAS